MKTDLETKVMYWEHAAQTPREAIFVLDPSRAEEEDSGWLLGVVLDGERGVSYLLCLDARNMREVGRAECGVAVGFGFHGVHVPFIRFIGYHASSIPLRNGQNEILRQIRYYAST